MLVRGGKVKVQEETEGDATHKIWIADIINLNFWRIVVHFSWDLDKFDTVVKLVSCDSVEK